MRVVQEQSVRIDESFLVRKFAHLECFPDRSRKPVSDRLRGAGMDQGCGPESDQATEKLGKHSKIWFKIPTGSWQIGTVQSVSSDGLLLCRFNDEILELEFKDIFPANPDILQGIDDLTKLSFLNEPSILHDLKARFEKDQIYTNAGPVVIALNPFKKIPLYGSELVRIYRDKELKDLNPHVFAITDSACTALFRDGINQSLVISGESGAGKTETAKIAMQYIATFGGGRGVEDEILESNPLLEAFGNAKTLRNDNSSRFGKLIDIYFDESGTVSGAKIQTYLLEKSRVVYQSSGERSYHVFYQLCAGADADLREHINLKQASDYYYLSKNGCITIDAVDDAAEFRSLLNALDRVRIPKNDQKHLFEMLAVVLWLGNISFTPENENCSKMAIDEAARSVASFLRCQIDALQTALCTRKINARGEVIVQQLTEAQAIDSRDALAKALYSCLFEWLVDKINNSLDGGSECQSKFISILDIYGFECFENNSFEQLCINYANERLQQFFNHHLFKIEQDEYTSEGIDWTKIEFVDNQECLDLIEKKPLGIITLLDEECNFPKATETSLALKLGEHLKANSCFKSERTSPGFMIKHYAGEVTYGTAGFLEKNRDLLHADLVELLGSCENELAQEFAIKLGERVNGVEIQRRSVFTKFKNQLLSMMERLETTSPHFIRCIKPNKQQLRNVFDDDLVLHQLHCCGVLEVVRIARSGYPTRYSYQHFADRYGFLIGQNTLRSDDDYRGCSLAVLREFSIPPGSFQAGLSKLFFRPGQIGILEHLRTRTLNAVIYTQSRFRGKRNRSTYLRLRRTTIYLQSLMRRRQARIYYENLKLVHAATIKLQKVSRGLIARKHYRIFRRKWFASIVIQKHARGFIGRRDYQQLKLVNQAVITIQKFYKSSLHARRWSRYWIPRLLATITLQRYYRGMRARSSYVNARTGLISIQALVRGWLCRKERKLHRVELNFSEDDSEYVNISAVDLDMEIENQKSPQNTEICAKVSQEHNEMQTKLLEMEKNLCEKEDENAELVSKLKSYEKRWIEYENKMNSMESVWQSQMASLQQSLEAAKRSLATTAALDAKQNFEVQSNASFRHRAARPILPQIDNESEFDWDEATSIGTKTPESTATAINREGHAVVDHLVREFEHRSQVFSDDIDFIVEVKSGQSDADLDPDMELKKLKQRFDIWKKDFKVQVRETKMVLQRLEASSERTRKKWWRQTTII